MTSQNPVDHELLSKNIDDCLANLRSNERAAISLRYLAGKSISEVSATLGITEPAAKKRVTRALARLRQILFQRNITTPADLLERNLSSLSSAAAPAALLAKVTTAAAHPGAASISVLSLTKGASIMATAAKAKAAGVLIAIILLFLITATASVAVWTMWTSNSIASPPTTPRAPDPAKPADKDLPVGNYGVELANGMRFEITGLCHDIRGGKGWWEPNGLKMNRRQQRIGTWTGGPDPAPNALTMSWLLYFPSTHGIGAYSIHMNTPQIPSPFEFSGMDFAPKTSVVGISICPWSFGSDQLATLTFAASVGPWERIATFKGLERTSGPDDLMLKLINQKQQPPVPRFILETVYPKQSNEFAYMLTGLLKTGPASTTRVLDYPKTLIQDQKTLDEYKGFELLRAPAITATIKDIHLKPSP